MEMPKLPTKNGEKKPTSKPSVQTAEGSCDSTGDSSSENDETSVCTVDSSSCGSHSTWPPSVAVGGKSLVYIKTATTAGCVVPAHPPRKDRKTSNSHLKVSPVVVEWFNKTFSRATQPLRIQLYTELTLGEGSDHRELIRAHPNFHKRPWYDFVEVDYGEAVGCYPARCACFFQWPPGIWPNTEFTAGDIIALVQQSKFQSNAEKERESLLFSHYTLESRLGRDQDKRFAKLECVPAAALNNRLFANDPQPSDTGEIFTKCRTEERGVPPVFSIVRVKDRKLHWPVAFLKSFLNGPEHAC